MKLFICNIASMRVSASVLLMMLSYALSASVVMAQAAPRAAQTLPAMIQRALARSELVAAHREFIEEVRGARNQALAWSNPTISLGGGARQAEGRTGPAFSVGLSQPLRIAGRSGIIGDLYGAEERIAGVSLEEARLFIRLEVTRLAYALQTAEENEVHLKERVERFRLIEGYLRSRPFVSPRKRLERNIVQGRLLLLQRNLAEIQSEKDTLWARLNFYLDMPEKPSLALPWFNAGPSISWEAVTAAALERNPAIMRQEALLSKTRQEARLASRAAVPDIDISAYYSQETAKGTERSFGAGVSLALPVLDQNRGALRSIEARSRAEHARLAHQRRLVAHELQVLRAGYRLAEENLRRFPRSLLAVVHGQMNEADLEFSRGTIELPTYLEAESQNFETHLAVFQSHREFVERYIAVLILAGSSAFVTGE